MKVKDIVNGKMKLFYAASSAVSLHSQRDQVSHRSVASQAAMVDASVAADTKKTWKGMAKAAGGSGGGVFQQSLGGGKKDYPI